MPIRSIGSRFRRDDNGNFAMMMAISLLPLMVAVGLLVDYSQATNTRSTMQQALDAAALAAVNQPAGAKRLSELRKVYKENSGLGEPSIVSETNVGEAVLRASATYSMPTAIMRIIGRNDMTLVINSAVAKPLRLVAAKFKPILAKGVWDKVITLYGRKIGTTQYEPLLKMVYKHPGGAYVGSTITSKFQNGAWIEIHKIDCTGLTVAEDCVGEDLVNDAQTEVDISQMDDVYMQMDISASSPEGIQYLAERTGPLMLRSNDPASSDSLFIDGVQQQKGTVVDIQRAIGCDTQSEQRWEDGGGYEGTTAWKGTDFWYQVTGRCDSTGSQRVRLTQ